VARYDYVCPSCGVFEVVRPMATATRHEPCPACGEQGGRVFSPPALTSPRSPLRRAREAADRSAHEPTVTSGTSPSPRRPAPSNPLHARLPRP
jgi:putative FmdB family regulatory protein